MLVVLQVKHHISIIILDRGYILDLLDIVAATHLVEVDGVVMGESQVGLVDDQVVPPIVLGRLVHLLHG